MTKDLEFLKNSLFTKYLGEKIFETHIPGFIEKSNKILMKRLSDCEARLVEEGFSSIRETPFEIRSKKKITEISHEKLIIDKPVAEGVLEAELKEEHKIIEENFYLESVTEDAQYQLENYSKVVPDQIKISLGDPSKAYSQALTMKFPAFLWVKSNNEILGLFILNLDTQKTVQTRLYISHISSKSIELLERIINIAVTYTSSNYPCDEIRVTLSSPENFEGKYVSDKIIKQFFSKLGFRWKKLLKDDNCQPIELLGLACKKEKIQTNQDIFKDPIQIFYSCAGQSSKKIISNDNYISALGIAAILNRMDIEKNVPNKLLQNLLDKVKSNWIPPAFKIKQEKSAEEVIDDIEKLGLSIRSLHNTDISLALCSVELNWNRFLTTAFNGLKYCYIYNSQINEMVSG